VDLLPILRYVRTPQVRSVRITEVPFYSFGLFTFFSFFSLIVFVFLSALFHALRYLYDTTWRIHAVLNLALRCDQAAGEVDGGHLFDRPRVVKATWVEWMSAPVIRPSLVF